MENLNKTELSVVDYLKERLITDVDGDFNFHAVSDELGISIDDLDQTLQNLQRQRILENYTHANDKELFHVALSI